MLHREPKIPPEYVYPVDEWKVVEDRFAPDYLDQSETVFALANGYLGIRGSFEEGRPVYQRGTFVNGFHEVTPITYGEAAYGFAETGQSMLHVPDACLLRLFVDDEPFVLEHAHLLRFARTLDMQAGVLVRSVLWETPAGKRVEIRSTRLVSLEHRHLAAIDYEVTVHNAEAPVVLISDVEVPGPVGSPAVRQPASGTDPDALDPRRGNRPSEPALLPELHRGNDDRIVIGHRVRRSGMTIACGIDHVVRTGLDHTRDRSCTEDGGQVVYTIHAQPGSSFRLTKYLTYHTSHTAEAAELAERAERTLDRARAEGWDALRASQQRRVAEFWDSSDVRIRGDMRVQQSLRWNLFQLMQASARVEGAGIGARGLTGPTYDGHYFWDTEIYVLPFLVYTNPRVARNLLAFRHGMLDAARRRAREVGEKGALFPWRTINGEEASAYYAAGTAQYHIDADIAYALRKYVEMSGDRAFLAEQGAEILVETARLWLSLGFFSPHKEGRFCINGVTGPDEYNTVVNNNLFTNVMARGNLRYAAQVVRALRLEDPERYAALLHKTGYEEHEERAWLEAAEAMYIPFDDKRGIHLQDDSFLDKQRWDLEGTPSEKYPLLLHYHPLVIYRHRVIKQADVVMALFLQSQAFSCEEKRADFDYYDPLTTGDSSLSVCIQSIVASEVGYHEEAYEYFRYAVLMDLADVGGNVRDGAHVAAIGGTWMAVTYGFAGMRDHDGELSFDPRLPIQWESMRFPIRVRDRRITVEVQRGEATYELVSGEELSVRHQDTEVKLRPGEPVTMPIRGREARVPLSEVERRISPERFDAVLFDMDGVLTATAEVHARAWKQMFDEFLQERARKRGEPYRPFELGTDYLLFVDGKPRQDGVHDFLQSRGISLPAGGPDDPPDAETERELGNRKNELVHEVIRRDGVRAFPGTVELLDRLERDGIRVAVVTSSSNADLTLEAAGLAGRFDAKVDGNVATQVGLAGKPSPDTYLEAARRLNASPERAVVIEDAISGVQAGRRGGFGLVVGVARNASPDELLRNGAHLAVADPGELVDT